MGTGDQWPGGTAPFPYVDPDQGGSLVPAPAVPPPKEDKTHAAIAHLQGQYAELRRKYDELRRKELDRPGFDFVEDELQTLLTLVKMEKAAEIDWGACGTRTDRDAFYAAQDKRGKAEDEFLALLKRLCG